MALATAAGAWGHGDVRKLTEDWAAVWQARESAVEEELSTRLDAVIESGGSALRELVDLPVEDDSLHHLSDALQAIRGRHGLDALAVYGPDGFPIAWAGTHQGPVPRAAKRALSQYIYWDGPLFGYLYFTAPLPVTGGTAVAVSLLRADLPGGPGGEVDSFAKRFRERTGELIRISRAERAAGEGIWDLVWEGRSLFSVSVVQPRQADRVAERRSAWVLRVTLLALLAWVLVALGGRARPRNAVWAGVVLLVGAAVVPLEPIPGFRQLLSPADFMFPGPGGLSLGRSLVLGLALAVALSFLRPALASRGSAWVTAAVVGGGFPLVVSLFGVGYSTEFLAGGEERWVAYQATLSLFLALLSSVAILLTAGSGRPRHPAWFFPLGLAATAVLSAGAFLSASLRAEVPTWMAVGWAPPAALMAVGLKSWGGWQRSLLAWCAALALGGSSGLPFAWGHRLTARMAAAEEEMQGLGSTVDPYLQYLLTRLGTAVDSLEAAGASPVEMLFGGWVASGLASEPYPLWLTLWSLDGVAQRELAIGVEGERPLAAARVREEAQEMRRGFVRPSGEGEAKYVAVAPLGSGDVITAVVAPRRRLGRGSPLGVLYTGSEPGFEPLTLVPLEPGEVSVLSDSLRWIRTSGGWQGELSLRYPDGPYHALYLLDVRAPVVLVARSTLLFFIEFLVLFGLWGVGRGLSGGRTRSPRTLISLASSFRARVTLALFGFFLLPLLAFGTMAYRTLGTTTQRASRDEAVRAVNTAAEWYSEARGDAELLSRTVGADLLVYDRGELVGGSIGELVELGLYGGWIPPPVFRILEDRRDLVATAPFRTGGWEYLSAYRILPDRLILASAAPLRAGATALRQQDIAYLLGFGLVAGGVFSLVLAFLVGRALAKPIQTLRVASERVGAGNLELHLSEVRSDEFGAVFSAFNRMVENLNEARDDLVRSNRRTRAIVEEAAIGVIALDSTGEVALVNPRAESLLEAPVEEGCLLPRSGGHVGEFVAWVEGYFRGGLQEATTEMEFGDRRIRIRARRIARGGSEGGAVVILEDVTDELRSERILAWGEMARQVAHEVKNPLTPIRLGIQHIQRAWEDGRPDFGEILPRNARAILGEIDRLATIARSFSSFAAPRAAGAQPLEAVDLRQVVVDTLELYPAGVGAAEFLCRVPEGLPAVRAREGELKEVLVNLLENARAAMAEGGKVTLDAERKSGEILLSIQDEGSGITEDLLPRIFEPHFSTRSSGTGLGLAIVRRLVESWGGHVTAVNRPEGGAVVQVRLLPWEAASAGSGDRGAGP